MAEANSYLYYLCNENSPAKYVKAYAHWWGGLRESGGRAGGENSINIFFSKAFTF